jgi:hypothetical protein
MFQTSTRGGGAGVLRPVAPGSKPTREARTGRAFVGSVQICAVAVLNASCAAPTIDISASGRWPGPVPASSFAFTSGATADGVLESLVEKRLEAAGLAKTKDGRGAESARLLVDVSLAERRPEIGVADVSDSRAPSWLSAPKRPATPFHAKVRLCTLEVRIVDARDGMELYRVAATRQLRAAPCSQDAARLVEAAFGGGVRSAKMDSSSR